MVYDVADDAAAVAEEFVAAGIEPAPAELAGAVVAARSEDPERRVFCVCKSCNHRRLGLTTYSGPAGLSSVVA